MIMSRELREIIDEPLRFAELDSPDNATYADILSAISQLDGAEKQITVHDLDHAHGYDD
jgi:hypothetical protein